MSLFCLPIGSRKQVNVVYSANAKEVDLDISTVTGYVAGITDVFITVNAGVYLWSDDVTKAGLKIRGGTATDRIKLLNNGYIMGRGGKGGSSIYTSPGSSDTQTVLTPPEAGGPAIELVSVQADIDTGTGYIAGGGGGGGCAEPRNTTNGYGFGGAAGGGGGAGGGPGGDARTSNSIGSSYTAGAIAAGGAGGTVGNAGSVGVYFGRGGLNTASELDAAGGGGGGLIVPGIVTNGPAAGFVQLDSLGSTTSSSYPSSGGLGGSAGGSGAGGYETGSVGAGGGGGWGQTGGDGKSCVQESVSGRGDFRGGSGGSNGNGGAGVVTSTTRPVSVYQAGAAGGPAIKLTTGGSRAIIGSTANIYGSF